LWQELNTPTLSARMARRWIVNELGAWDRGSDEGVCPTLRSLRTIVVLLLALAALVPLGGLRIAAGAWMSGETQSVASARPTEGQSAVAQAAKPHADAIPCRHTRKDKSCEHNTHLPCCTAPAVFGLPMGPEWIFSRDARRIGPAYRVSVLCPSSTHLSGFERPPKRG
jgi:hypothetical protein